MDESKSLMDANFFFFHIEFVRMFAKFRIELFLGIPTTLIFQACYETNLSVDSGTSSFLGKSRVTNSTNIVKLSCF